MMHTVCIDFDGVIHQYSKGRHDDSIYDPPMPGAFDAIRLLISAGYAVVVFSARDTNDIAAWMAAEFDCVVDDGSTVFWRESPAILITNRKLPCWAYIDDRAIQFKDWSQTLDDLAAMGGPT